MMAEQTPTPESPQRMSLSVLPNSGKVEQLRKEFQKGEEPPTTHGSVEPGSAPPGSAAADKGPAHQSLIDRALDPRKTPRQKAIEEKVIEAIRQVYDPEIPVNIYDLGLIYAIEVAPDDRVKVKMTLTAPGCPVAGTLPPEVERRIETIDEVPSATVELVWDPPWGKERMSEAALLELGLM